MQINCANCRCCRLPSPCPVLLVQCPAGWVRISPPGIVSATVLRRDVDIVRLRCSAGGPWRQQSVFSRPSLSTSSFVFTPRTLPIWFWTWGDFGCSLPEVLLKIGASDPGSARSLRTVYKPPPQLKAHLLSIFYIHSYINIHMKSFRDTSNMSFTRHPFDNGRYYASSGAQPTESFPVTKVPDPLSADWNYDNAIDLFSVNSMLPDTFPIDLSDPVSLEPDYFSDPLAPPPEISGFAMSSNPIDEVVSHQSPSVCFLCEGQVKFFANHYTGP